MNGGGSLISVVAVLGSLLGIACGLLLIVAGAGMMGPAAVVVVPAIIYLYYWALRKLWRWFIQPLPVRAEPTYDVVPDPNFVPERDLPPDQLLQMKREDAKARRAYNRYLKDDPF